MAQTLVRIPLRDQAAQIRAFLAAADRADAGETAGRKYLGRGLVDFAAEFLGADLWEPQRNHVAAADPGGTQ